MSAVDLRRRTTRGVTWATLAVALAVSPAIAAAKRPPAQSSAGALAAALDTYNKATIANDTRALGALVTDDYLLVNSDGSVQRKASYLADFLVPGFRIKPYRIEDGFSRIGAGAAMTGGRFVLTWTQDGRSQSRHLRVAHFWVQDDGRWRLAYTQLTRVAG